MLNINTHNSYNTRTTTIPPHTMSHKPIPMRLSSDVFVSNSKNSTPALTFKGITTALSSKIYATTEEIKSLFANHKSSNGIVGELPQSWASKTSENKEKAAIYKGLAETSQTLMEPIKHIMRNYTEYYIDNEGDKIVIMDPEINLDAEYDMSMPMKKASVILTNTLKAHKIIQPDERVDLKLDKVDTTASYFVFKAGTEDFTMKVFHPFYKDDFSTIGGKYIEANRAAYISKNCPDSNYVKFFCEDINNNYMLLKHVTEETPEPKNIFNAKEYGLIECAHPIKRTGHYINDYGVLLINKNTILANNTVSRKTYIAMENTPEEKRLDKFNELLNKKTSDIQDVLVGLALSIGLLDNSDRTKLFQTLIPMNDSMEMKEALASQLNFIEEKEIPVIINQLLDGADEGLIDSVMSKYHIYFDQDETTN